MIAQNDLVVAGVDVAKDKVDVCIRSLSLRRTFASTAEGRRELASWLRRIFIRLLCQLWQFLIEVTTPFFETVDSAPDVMLREVG